MSCFKIIIIFTKILLIISYTKALAKEPNQVVVAKVNDHIITAQDILNATNRLPNKIKSRPLSEIYPKIINELINQHLITKQAYKDKFDQKKEIIELVKKNKDRIMAKYWLNNFLANQTKEENIKSFYKKYRENFQIYKEYNASHILVKEENEALEIIKKLKLKSDFPKFAETYSIGPSKKNGGDLGWFGPGQMVKEFEEATFKLKKGMITKEPVKTQFGYHIIMLNDIRNSKPRSLSKVRQNIIDRIKKQSLFILEKEMRKNEKISVLDFEKVVLEINNK